MSETNQYPGSAGVSPANPPVIEIRDLYHTYKRQQALGGISFKVDGGSIHGFVGPNGAGKTATLKILATLLKPQRGAVRVFGLDVVRDYKGVRRKIGFMPDHFSLYRQMTVQEYLDFFAAAYGMNYQQRAGVVGTVLALTDMEGAPERFDQSLVAWHATTREPGPRAGS